jgi:hypothetical protein
MKLILAALLLGTQPAVIPTEAPKAVEQETRSRAGSVYAAGSLSITQIRTDYNAGGYDDLLKELTGSYKKVAKDGGLENLTDMRLGALSSQGEWEELLQQTVSERNKELVRAIASDKDSSVSQKVLSITTPLDQSLTDSLSVLARFHTMQPGEGADADENALIDIDLEYAYKSLHLDRPVLSGQPGEELRAKHMALRMEQMDRMLEASQRFENADLKRAVEVVYAHTDALLAQNWDMLDLQAIVRKPGKTDVEENVSSILVEYRQKFSDLSKEFLAKQTLDAQVEQ